MAVGNELAPAARLGECQGAPVVLVGAIEVEAIRMGGDFAEQMPGVGCVPEVTSAGFNRPRSVVPRTERS